MKRTQLVVTMVLALAAVLAVAVWDERREARAALEDFAAQQTAVARSAAIALADRVDSPECADVGSPCLLGALQAIGSSTEQPGAVRVLVRVPAQPQLLDASGKAVTARESRALWRLVLGTALAALLVGCFGGLALREQRRELELHRCQCRRA